VFLKSFIICLNPHLNEAPLAIGVFVFKGVVLRRIEKLLRNTELMHRFSFIGIVTLLTIDLLFSGFL